MTADGESGTGRKSPSPISVFAATFEERFRGSVDPWRVLAQLGVPPDLRYLNDGLARSAAVIRACSEELDELLSINAAESPLFSVTLLEGIDSMRALAAERDWSYDGSALLEMARMSDVDRHPLRSYCLNALNHWSLLFYSTPPALIQQLSIPNSIEAACEEFFPYLLTAQALVPVTRYQDFMERWWSQKKLPGLSLIPDSAMDSRLGNATLAMRRLSTADSLPLLAALTDASHTTFCERLAAAQTTPGLSLKNLKRVNDLALLVECLNPHWRSPGKRRRSLTGRRRQTTHHLEEDGYIRVSEKTVAHETDTESGLTVTSYSLEAEKCAEDDEDGVDVLPMADRLSGESLTTATLDIDDEVHARVSSHPIKSRWIADHIRRDNFSHALTAHRVLHDDIDSIIAAMQAVPEDPELREMLVRLHASIAVATLLKDTSKIVLSDSRLEQDPKVRTVVYRRDTQMWEIRVFPPGVQ